MTIGPIERSQRAQGLLDDPLFQDAFEVVERSIVERLKAGKQPNDEELLMLWRLLPKLKGYLKQAAESGKVEMHEEEQRKKK